MTTSETIDIPDIHSFPQVIEKALAKTHESGPIPAAVICPNDADMLLACAKAESRGMIRPIMIGDRFAYEETCRENGVLLHNREFYPAATGDEAAQIAASLTAKGEVKLIIKGRILTSEMLRILFDPVERFSTGKTISHVAVLKPSKYPKFLLLTDSGVIPEPDLQAKLDMIQNLVAVANRMGLRNPRIAVLAAVEVVYLQMPTTLDGAILAKMSERGQIKGARVDGPLSFDVAVDMFAAHSKGVTKSEVAGQADALLAPNIETANGIYKGMALYGQSESGGVIIGGRVPIALSSRSDARECKYNSLALGALMA